MKTRLIEDYIRGMVSECVEEVMLENTIRRIVAEAFVFETKKKKNKKTKSAKKAKKGEKKTGFEKNRKSEQYGNELAKDEVNMTAIVRKDHPNWKDSTVRSYASKLSRGERSAPPHEATKGLHRLHATFG